MQSAREFESMQSNVNPLVPDTWSSSVCKSGTVVRKLDSQAWDTAVVGFKDVIHEQTSCFNELRWRPHQLERLMVYNGNEALGGAVVRKVRIPVTNKKLAIIRWGPVWRRFGKADDPQIMRTVYQSIASQLSEKDKCFVLLIPRADPVYSPQEAELLNEMGFKHGYKPDSPERYFVNVDQDTDQMRASLSQKWRYNLKKAEKNGLEASFLSGPEGLKDFFDLYSSMVNRKKYEQYASRNCSLSCPRASILW